MQKRNEVIRVLTQRVLVVETREENVKEELSLAQQQLSELEQKQQCIIRKCEGFEVTKWKCCKFLIINTVLNLICLHQMSVQCFSFPTASFVPDVLHVRRTNG